MSIREKIDDNFLYYFNRGECLEAYKYFGAHLIKDNFGNNIGCEFCLYAPNASRVDLIGNFNNFTEGVNSLELIHQQGVWYLSLNGNYEWNTYKYVIHTKQGAKLYKSDPYAFYSDFRPKTDSRVYNIDGYDWNDEFWMFTHPKTYDKPLLIYELHLGSWKRKQDGKNSFLNYIEIAKELISYLKNYGYTHVEIMPVYEHPLDASWGYQGTGYYSITSRFGAPKDFMYFIDLLHQEGIGVIIDWVPGHICKDAHGLYNFDGTYLYEYAKEEDRENKEWGTANLDLGKGVTRSFLYSNALFYMNYFHVDGFRVDAVSNLIYWLGDSNRGVNEGATSFIGKLSQHIFNKDDRVLLMAEDSSNFPDVTKPAGVGLGFNYKWDMGWMNDTLSYFKLDPIYRKNSHHKLTFSMMYYYNEQFVLPFSHDEVVHMKGSLLNKMPGDYWQQFANYRCLIGYMITHPGKKLLFMGNELAPYSEWAFEKELDWHLNKFPAHDSANRFVKELTIFYRNEPALWELDYDKEGFEFIDADNMDQSLYVYARFSKKKDEHLVIVMNCTPNSYYNYKIGVMGNNKYVEVINSDKDIYGGSNNVNNQEIIVTNDPCGKYQNSIFINIPPLGISILKHVPKPKNKRGRPKGSKNKKKTAK